MASAQPPVKRILIIEDDVAIRDALSLILEDEGFQVSCAGNGQEALGQLRSGPLPNLILLDLMMPVMDGWQFRALQTQDPALASIPIVVLSADANIPDKAASIGAADYLQKPIELDSLLQIVRRHS